MPGGNLARVYDKSPTAVQNIMVTGQGAINYANRYGVTYWMHRRWLSEYDAWGLERRIEDQNAQLRQLVQHAANRSQFYSRYWAGIDSNSIISAQDLPILPALEKELLREHMQTVYTIPRGRAIEGHTGGTTGKSLIVRFTVSDFMRRMAVLDHFKARHGFRNGRMRRATFSGKHVVPPTSSDDVFWRYNATIRQMLYSTFHINEDNLARYVVSLNDFKPLALDGFFSSLCDVASYIERHDIKLSFRPKAIFPTSEAVTERGRKLLERVFRAPVRNQYSSSEGAPFAVECVEGAMHVVLSSGVFENVGTNDEVLVTSFSTHGTPLIRYRIGDSMAITSDVSCNCGDPSPQIASIEGRSSDHLRRSDGARVNGGHVANLFKNMPNALIQAQVQQSELGKVRILLVTDPAVYRNTYDDLLIEEFRHTFDADTSLEIEHVSAIRREKSGKHRLIKNTIVGETDYP